MSQLFEAIDNMVPEESIHRYSRDIWAVEEIRGAPCQGQFDSRLYPFEASEVQYHPRDVAQFLATSVRFCERPEDPTCPQEQCLRAYPVSRTAVGLEGRPVAIPQDILKAAVEAELHKRGITPGNGAAESDSGAKLGDAPGNPNRRPPRIPIMRE